jgi:hypothetical protein
LLAASLHNLFEAGDRLNGEADMKMKIVVPALFAAALAATAFADDGTVPTGIMPLTHVFLIVMENHGFGQIYNNPNAPFINEMASSANYATNYFAVGHPSSTNYLGIVGGSNFGVRSDDYPNWHNSTCSANLISGVTTLDTPASNPPLVCPIVGAGMDAATPALDCSRARQGTAFSISMACSRLPPPQPWASPLLTSLSPPASPGRAIRRACR